MTKEEFAIINKSNILVLDIREEEEVRDLPCIPGAIHIPISRLMPEIQRRALPEGKKIITVCYSGGRCHGVNRVLSAHGYEVDYLEGGMCEIYR